MFFGNLIVSRLVTTFAGFNGTLVFITVFTRSQYRVIFWDCRMQCACLHTLV